jgi:hypothetical protein|nr:MAG TPA: SH3 domain protein [Caudoviricetes sp.]
MKNWLIEKLGGVPKPIYDNLVGRYFYKLGELATTNEKVISLKAEKAEMEEAGKAMSERISELIDKLNEANRTINGLRQIVNGTAISSAEKNKKIEELQAEIEAKNAELSRVKSEIIAISKVKADTTLKAENQRLKAELELLKRNKFKRGRK